MNIVPADSPSIYAALSTLQMQNTLLALVRPNNPPPGIAGFLLDVVDDDGVELESDITDNYTEANTAIQDHIALRPEIVTVTGSVAELVFATQTSKAQSVPPNPLPLVPGLSPTLAPAAAEQQAATIAAAASTQAAASSSQSLYGYYQSKSPQQPNQTKQSLVYGYFYQLYLGRQLFSVETPWGFFTNMAILSLSAKQGAASRSVTDFSITFKKIRVAQSIVIQVGQLAGRAVFQQAGTTQNGFAGQQSVSTSQSANFYAWMKANP
jgi:hypothetical protein